MQVTLYRGTEEFQAELAVDEETGEIAADYPLEVLVARNPVGTVAYMLNGKAHADMIDAHIKKMTAKKGAILANIERAKESLKTVMQATGVLSIKSECGTFAAKLDKERDESIEVFDSLQIPLAYLREVTTTAPDKAAIKAAIKDGKEVPGCKLVKKDRLSLK